MSRELSVSRYTFVITKPRRLTKGIPSASRLDTLKRLSSRLAEGILFTHSLYVEAKRLELNIIEVDTMMTEDDLARRVTEQFGL